MRDDRDSRGHCRRWSAPSAARQAGCVSHRIRRHGVSLITLVAAARPNLMKVAPVMRALDSRCQAELVHTGQHYDRNLSGGNLRDLDLPEPDLNMGVGSGTHSGQTAAVLVSFEQYLLEKRPGAVVVVGDVNSTLAAALAAAKLDIPVAHVEAGLRSWDWSMPEEINRVLADRLSRWLFTPSADADENLLAEGIPRDRVYRVGNVMIDTLLHALPRARQRSGSVAQRCDVGGRRYGLLTLHRPSTVDHAEPFNRVLEGVAAVATDIPLLFPMHPRTKKNLRQLGVRLPSGVSGIDPLGYLDFLSLMDRAAIVLTDSGGVQEETSMLGVPCLTLRANTERPVTVELGTNQVVGTDPAAIIEGAQFALSREWEPAQIPMWDGRAAERIADVLVTALSDEPPAGGLDGEES